MLDIIVKRKYYDKDGVLVGYGIADVHTGELRTVHKDQLKMAIKSGVVNCVNMTMTSDGRLIGKAKPDPKWHRKPKQNQETAVNKPIVQPAIKQSQNSTGIVVDYIITNGKKIGGAMVNCVEHNKRCNVQTRTYAQLPKDYTFETGLDVEACIKSRIYDNIRAIDGKIDYSNTRKVSYSKIKPKLIKILEANRMMPELKVVKSSSGVKYQYDVLLDNYETYEDMDEMQQIVYVLIENEMILARNKVINFSDEGLVTVECLTGIDDVRKAVKAIFKK